MGRIICATHEQLVSTIGRVAVFHPLISPFSQTPPNSMQRIERSRFVSGLN